VQEKLKPFTIIATKNELEEISKKILDSESMEIVPLENLIDDEILIRLKNEKENPYETLYENFLRIFELAERTPEPKTWRIKFPLVFNKDEVREFSEELYKSMREISQKVEELKTERNQLSREIELFEKLKPLRIKMEELRKLRTFKYKVGRINRAYFERLIESVKKDNILILSLNGDENFMWVFIIYEATLEIDKTLSIANFIEHRISENYEGTPRDILWNLWDKYRALEYEIETLKLTLKKKFFENRRYIYKYFDRIYVLKNIYDSRAEAKSGYKIGEGISFPWPELYITAPIMAVNGATATTPKLPTKILRISEATKFIFNICFNFKPSPMKFINKAV